ncbi:hypothetical protein D9613_010954 [Agrocybe pediades]|uniref:Uncharacterized protein n=1 Tax=Agrocybe pediades TaxID=84607 RepID=A0A8H4QLT8_9AGAR|nr:hypothetical protein D9613_010954 [Agrocybe pediades]
MSSAAQSPSEMIQDIASAGEKDINSGADQDHSHSSLAIPPDVELSVKSVDSVNPVAMDLTESAEVDNSVTEIPMQVDAVEISSANAAEVASAMNETAENEDSRGGAQAPSSTDATKSKDDPSPSQLASVESDARAEARSKLSAQVKVGRDLSALPEEVQSQLDSMTIPFPPDDLAAAKEIVLDLLGWGVKAEDLVSSGVSPEAIYRIFTDLNLRLPGNLQLTEEIRARAYSWGPPPGFR